MRPLLNFVKVNLSEGTGKRPTKRQWIYSLVLKLVIRKKIRPAVQLRNSQKKQVHKIKRKALKGNMKNLFLPSLTYEDKKKFLSSKHKTH